MDPRKLELLTSPIRIGALSLLCGPEETRTPYLYNANVALYQMSYGPKTITNHTLSNPFLGTISKILSTIIAVKNRVIFPNHASGRDMLLFKSIFFCLGRKSQKSVHITTHLFASAFWTPFLFFLHAINMNSIVT